MVPIRPTKTVFTVSNFLDWQRNQLLVLKPTFQRREVWGPKAKSLFIDSIAKGLPIPIIFLRSIQDLRTFSSSYEVVDGQQRLRTLFSFIDASVLSDYDESRDYFKVLPVHNSAIASKNFKDLPRDVQSNILGHELSTHVLPPETADDVVLRIFARMNSTGAKLNHQELRNSQFFGQFKTISYDLAIDTLPFWRKWEIFSDDNFARMAEVETTSDLLVSMMDGLKGRSQDLLERYYSTYDDDFLGAEILASRFGRVVSEIDDKLGDLIGRTSFKRSALFFSLFVAIYDHMYGLGTEYRRKRAPRSLPSDINKKLKKVDELIVNRELPPDVEDAVVKATTDTGRRITRHDFLMERLTLAAAA